MDLKISQFQLVFTDETIQLIVINKSPMRAARGQGRDKSSCEANDAGDTLMSGTQ